MTVDPRDYLRDYRMLPLSPGEILRRAMERDFERIVGEAMARGADREIQEYTRALGDDFHGERGGEGREMREHYHTLDSTGRCVLPDCPDRAILFTVSFLGGVAHSDGTDVVFTPETRGTITGPFGEPGSLRTFPTEIEGEWINDP